MTSRACVGRSQTNTQLRPRNPEAVVSPRIDHHVRGRWHVTLDTTGSRRAGLMMMMVGRVVLSRRMLVTRRTQLIVGELHFRGMRIVAVRTSNSVVVHLALNKRTVNVVFVPDLAISEIDRIRNQLGRKVIVEIATRFKNHFGSRFDVNGHGAQVSICGMLLSVFSLTNPKPCFRSQKTLFRFASSM